MKRTALFVLTPLLLAGCGSKPDPGVYPLALPDAFARLQKADIAGFEAAEGCGIALAIDPVASAPDTVEWRVSTGLTDAASFTVRLASDGDDATHASIEVASDPRGGEIYDGGKHYDRPALQQPLRPALEELVASAMEERKFDVARLPQPATPDDDCRRQRVETTGSAGGADAAPRSRIEVSGGPSTANAFGQPAPSAFAPGAPAYHGANSPDNPDPGIGFGNGSSGDNNPAAAGHEGQPSG